MQPEAIVQMSANLSRISPDPSGRILDAKIIKQGRGGWLFLVVANDERQRIARTWKDPNGKVLYAYESLGWFITLRSKGEPTEFVINTPDYQPFRPGSYVRMYLEQEPSR